MFKNIYTYINMHILKTPLCQRQQKIALKAGERQRQSKERKNIKGSLNVKSSRKKRKNVKAICC